ncbi:fluoride efflux transporter CrcB [Nitrospira sp. Nam74]
MGVYAFLAVFGGAGLGAWLRWILAIRLNPVFPTLPLGTLAANLVGGYLIGVAVAYFAHNTSVPPEIRLLIITGFMGGLTTFSTFSAEVMTLLTREQYAWAAVLTALHLGGSVLLTGLGILTIKMLVTKG